MAAITQNDLQASITPQDVASRPEVQEPAQPLEPTINSSGDPEQDKINAMPKDTFGERVSQAGASISHQASVAHAAWSQGDWFGSMMTYGPAMQGHYNPNFNGPDAVKGTPYENNSMEFINANNPDEVSQIEQHIDKANENNSILQHAGPSGTVWSIASGLVDPLNIIPASGLATKGLDLLEGAAKGIATGAGYGAGFGTANAVGVGLSGQPFQSQRNNFSNIAASAVIGGILGGAGGAISTAAKADVTNTLSTILNTGEPPKIPVNGEPVDRSIGAAQSTGQASSDASLAHLGSPTTSKSITNTMQVGGWLGKYGEDLRYPILDGLQSPFSSVKDLTQKLFNVSPYLVKNTEEGGFTKTDVSVEEKVLQDRQQGFSVAKKIDDQYIAYTKNNAADPNMMNRSQFRDEVFRAQATGQHDIPEVVGAQKLLEDAYAQWRPKLSEINELPADMTIPEENYQRVVYDTDKVVNNREAFINDTAQWLQSQGADRDTAMEQAQEHTDKIIGRGDVRVALQDMAYANLYSGTSWLKERTFMRPAQDMMQWLKTDPVANYLQYNVQASRFYNMKKLMEGQGVDNINDLIKQVDDELSNNPNSGLTDRDAAQAKQQLKNFLDISTGRFMNHTVYDAATDHLKFWNYLAYSGSFPVTAITHLGVPLLKHNLGDVIMNGWGKMITDMVSGLSGAKADDMEAAGVALERTQNSAMRDLLDPTFNDGFASKAKQVENKIMDGYGSVTGMNQLVHISKNVASNIAESVLTRDIKNYDKLDASGKEYLANNHIDASNVEAIQEQMKKWGDPKKGIANYSLWDNAEAKQTMVAALNKELGNMVPRSGMGNTLTGIQRSKSINIAFQFTNFLNALNANMIIPAMQRRSMNSIGGITAITALGSVSYMLKELIAGRKPDTSPDRLILEGLSRSALLGLFTSPAFGAIIGELYPDSYQGHQNTYKSSSILDLMGPTATDAQAIYKMLSEGKSLADGQISREATIKQISKQAINIMPFHNLWYLKGLYNNLGKN